MEFIPILIVFGVGALCLGIISGEVYSDKLSYYSTTYKYVGGTFEYAFYFKDFSSSTQALLNWYVALTGIAVLFAVIAVSFFILYLNKESKPYSIIAGGSSLIGGVSGIIAIILSLVFADACKKPGNYSSSANVSSEDCQYMVCNMIFPIILSFVVGIGVVFIALASLAMAAGSIMGKPKTIGKKLH